MKKNLIIITILSIMCFSFINDKPAYRIFSENGEVVDYTKMLEKLKSADIVFFGELHNNSIAHWLQFELTKDLFKNSEKQLVLGAEMFEADNQLLLDEYLNNLISEKKFESEVRLWPNYETDYKPLVKFAKDNNIFFIATNVPRRYASIVNKGGFEELEKLSDEAKKYFAPLPIMYDKEVGCYKKMLAMSGKMKAHINENFPKAQALKDATMAYFILKNYKHENLFIHYNGSYHSDNHEGIVWHIKQKEKDLKILTISTVLQESVDTLSEENKNIADFIICVPETMTRTY
ncbi:MAG: ChaN family lipoprotein [Bacteroidales bacterium]|nr:ChaN family lipoprotein [Bacteroidales bacterium]